jgi:hypothetical protein
MFVTDNRGTLVQRFVVWLKTNAVLQYRIQMLENTSVMSNKVHTYRMCSVL